MFLCKMTVIFASEKICSFLLVFLPPCIVAKTCKAHSITAFCRLAWRQKSYAIILKIFSLASISKSLILHSAFCILHYILRCLSLGTTQVPLALQTTTGGSRVSQAVALISGRGVITFIASKVIFRDVLPIWTISPLTSM